jgi:hypothetical protein
MVAARFDTAGDFITFLELRGDVMPSEQYTVHDEEGNIKRIIPHVRDVLERHMSPSTPEELEKTVAALVATASGEWLASPDRQFGPAIDDIIARAHDVQEPADPARRRKNLVVAEFLGWLTRARRMSLGKRLVQQCLDARDGNPHYFVHVQKERGPLACTSLLQKCARSGLRC